MKCIKLSVWDHVYRVVAIFFAAIYLINSFLSSNMLFYINCFLMIIILCKSIPSLPKDNKMIVLSLFGVGVLVLLLSKASFEIWLKAIMQGSNLVTLFICTSMISLPFFYEDYQGELISVVKSRIPSLITFCILVFFSTHIFGVLISIGAVTVIYDLMLPQAKVYKAEDEFLGTVLCAYCSSGFWSPAWASILTVSASTKTPWLKIVPVGIGMAVIYFLIFIVFLYIKTKKNPQKYKKLELDKNIIIDWKKIRIMLMLALFLILIIIVMNIVTDWTLLVIVSVVSVFYPALCAILQNQMKKYKEGMIEFYNYSLDRIHGQVSLFAAASFLGVGLRNFGIDRIIEILIPQWLILYPVLMCTTIMLVIILPSLVGIHPVVTGTAITTVIVPQSIGLSGFIFAITVITGWLLGILLSPFSATSLMGARYSGKSSVEVSLGINGRFGFLIVGLFSIIIGLSNLLF